MHTTEPTALQLTGPNVDNNKTHQTDEKSPTPSKNTESPPQQPIRRNNSNLNNNFLINNNEKTNNSINNNNRNNNNNNHNNNNNRNNKTNSEVDTANGVDGTATGTTTIDVDTVDTVNSIIHINPHPHGHKNKKNRKPNRKNVGGYVAGKFSKGAKSGRSLFSLHRRPSSTGGGVWQTTLNTAAAMTGVGQTMSNNELSDPLKIINGGDGGDDVDPNGTNNKLLAGDGGGMGGLGGNGAPPSTAATAVATTAPAGPKRPVRRGNKAQPDRAPRVLFCLGLKNPLRKLCIDIVEWKYPFYKKTEI